MAFTSYWNLVLFSVVFQEENGHNVKILLLHITLSRKNTTRKIDVPYSMVLEMRIHNKIQNSDFYTIPVGQWRFYGIVFLLGGIRPSSIIYLLLLQTFSIFYMKTKVAFNTGRKKEKN